ncbi:MAG: sugar porter family MFS transporter [Haliscomenobacter sp.]|nr:sugar porter family MFS transporter [Haliscomenobacter sp.]MBK9490723.1 sugar porter family MFS transporter [Haliscomenobacter sp.]
MNRKIIVWSVTVALGGFLFGLDTAVISGAEQAIQKLWSLNDFWHGTAVAMALYGTVFGAALGGWPSDAIGRKRTLFWIGIMYFVSALGSALATDVNTFMVFRFIGGLGVGASSVAAPLYISEISPAKSRGQLVAIFQFNIVLGILIAYVSNYALQGIGGEDAWRWMLGVVSIPSVAFIVFVLFVPESPRWLIVKRNEEVEARKVLAIINPGMVDESVAAIRASVHQELGTKVERFFSRKYSWPILLAFLFALFNQVSGINAVIYYAPRIFKLAGQEASTALLSSAGIGLINLVFTLIGVTLIDRFGRKFLMYIGSIGYIISLSLIANAFFSENYAGITYFLFAFIAAHAIGQGAVIWVFISEIFPNQVRAAGQSFGSFTHWIFAALIANVFPLFANDSSSGTGSIFLFFTAMMVLQLLFVAFMMPETKGVSLEDMEKRIVGH